MHADVIYVVVNEQSSFHHSYYTCREKYRGAHGASVGRYVVRTLPRIRGETDGGDDLFEEGTGFNVITHIFTV